MHERESPWRRRRVLVTGCTGFLGGAVVHELLTRGAEVVGLTHERPAMNLFGHDLPGRFRFIQGRADNVFRVHSAMAVHEVAAVFHIASHDVFSDDRGTAAVIQAVRLYSRRVPVVTARPLPPLAIARTDGPAEERLSIVRFEELFGPGDRNFSHVVPATAVAILSGEPPPLPCDAPPRDFVFVRDAARACLLAAETVSTSGPGDYAFRSGWVFTERQMAAAVRDSGNGVSTITPAAGIPHHPLGWHPAQPLAEALSETLAWYSELLRPHYADPLRAAA